MPPEEHIDLIEMPTTDLLKSFLSNCIEDTFGSKSPKYSSIVGSSDKLQTLDSLDDIYN